jgi:hypothetical protein
MRRKPRRQDEWLRESLIKLVVLMIFLFSSDISPALSFRAGMNVLLSAKAEIPTGTRQRLRSFF